MRVADATDAAGLSQAVREGDRLAWLAALFAPEAVRPALIALAAYHLELRRIVEAAREPLAAEIRLQWWCDAIAGTGTGSGRSLALVDALREGVARYGWPVATLCAMGEAHVPELHGEAVQELAAFDAYAGAAFGGRLRLAAMALGVAALGAAGGLAAAEPAAGAAAWGGIVLAVREATRNAASDIARGRSRLPISLPMVAGGGEAAPTDGEVAEAVRAMAKHGATAHAQLGRLMREIAAEVRAAFLPALAVRASLAAAERRPLAPREPSSLAQQVALLLAARAANRA